MLADEVAKMPLENSVFGPLSYFRILEIRLGFPDNPAEMKAVAPRNRFENLSGTNTEKFLLQILGNLLEEQFRVAIRIPALGGDFFHRHSVLSGTEKRLACRIERIEFDRFDLESG
jgi:hypothetical protein